MAEKSVPMLSHFEEIIELWDIMKESGKVLARWMKGIAMEARCKHFKMTCHWDTYLTLCIL